MVNVAGTSHRSNYDEQFLRRSNFKRRVEVSVPTFSLAPQLVVGHRSRRDDYHAARGQVRETLPLRLLPLPIAMPPMVEMLQWHKVHEYDPAHHWFRGLLRTVVQRLPSQPPVIRGGRVAARQRPFLRLS